MKHWKKNGLFGHIFQVLLITGICAGLHAIFPAPSVWADESANPVAHPYPPGDKGDIWLLAGQSNCFGYAPLARPIEPDPRILFYVNPSAGWLVAKESLGLMPNVPEKPTKEGTVGWNLMFAKALIKHANRPIGLIRVGPDGNVKPETWKPETADREEESASIFTSINQYEAVIPKVSEAGGYGKLKGMIWYQGESDAVIYPSAAPHYEENLTRFIERVRRETGNPNLPVIVVQLDRLVHDTPPGEPGKTAGGEEMKDMFATYTQAWEQVREAQRRVADKIENAHLVSAVDLDQMADNIHIGFDSHERLASRLAEVALSQVYKKPGHGAPIRLESVKLENSRHAATGEVLPDQTTIRVRFSGVTGRLGAAGHPIGFNLRSGRPEDKDRPTYYMNLRPRIYSTEFDPQDPSVVLLRLNGPPAKFVDNYKPSLYYGAGMNPNCTIVDEKDIPIPAFGPYELIAGPVPE